MFANNVVRALLPVGGHVAMGQAVPGQTPGSRYSRVFENRLGETLKPTHVNLGGRQTRCCSDRIVVSELDVREPQIRAVSYTHLTLPTIYSV